jgi:probable F420-dependent oxidoreductase
MDVGLTTFVTDYSISPDELARAAEERGFESLFFPEHTHIPVSRRSPWPGGAELPTEYSHALDPFVALAAAATATERLRLGTGVCLVIEHDPITLAKLVASLDHLSGGRVLFGVGAGWNREEMENHGTDPRRRFQLLRERIEAMRVIWANEEAEYQGELVRFEPIWSWPKPVQRPGPPVLVGGNGPGTLDRVVEFGDGWMPLAGRAGPPLAERIDELRRLASERGRGELPVTVFAAPPRREDLARLAELGVVRALLGLVPRGRDETLAQLDRHAALWP